jgi:hypothetical protein
MKLANIPPVSMISSAQYTDYQLVLPQIVNQYPKYEDGYRHLTVRGDFIILDNGAAELGSPLPWTKILSAARHVGANELVLPDVYRDPIGTKQAVQAWEDYDNSVTKLGTEPKYKYMAVVAGHNYQDIMKLVSWYYNKSYITTLGIPRHFVETVDARARIKIAYMINELYPDRFEMHMLGTNPMWMAELKEFKVLDFVRGVDTSAAFVYAYSGHRVDCGKCFTRPSFYFDLPEKVIDWTLVLENIKIMEEWING